MLEVATKQYQVAYLVFLKGFALTLLPIQVLVQSQNYTSEVGHDVVIVFNRNQLIFQGNDYISLAVQFSREVDVS